MMNPADTSSRSILKHRPALLLAALAFCALTWAFVAVLGSRIVEVRLVQSIDSIANAYRDMADVSLDLGLSIYGNDGDGTDGGMLSMPPVTVQAGSQPIIVRMERMQIANPLGRVHLGKARMNEKGEVEAERIITSSYGEGASRLVVSRSIDDVKAYNRTRLYIGLGVLALAGLAFAVVIYKGSVRSVIWSLGLICLPVAFIGMLTYGGEVAGVFRQSALLVATDIDRDVSHAVKLGIPVDELVGMEKYLSDKIVHSPAIERIEVRHEGKILYSVDHASQMVSLVRLLPFLSSPNRDLMFSESATTPGVTVRVGVSLEPIAVDLSMLVIASILFWTSGLCLVNSMWSGRPGLAAARSGAVLSLSLLFLLIVIILSTIAGQQTGPAEPAAALQFTLLSCMLIIGLLFPRTWQASVVAVAVPLTLWGFTVGNALLPAVAGLICGVLYRRSVDSVHGLRLLPMHVMAALVPSMIFVAVYLTRRSAAQDVGLSLIAGLVVISAIILLLPFRKSLKAVSEGGSVASHAFAPLHAILRTGLKGQGMEALGSVWFMPFLFIMRTAGFIVLLLLVRLEMPELSLQPGPGGLLLVLLTLYLAGGQCARLLGRLRILRAGSTARWVALEIAVLLAMILVARVVLADSSLPVNVIMTVPLMGAAAWWTGQLPFISAGARDRLFSVVDLLALTVAGGLSLISLPRSDAILFATIIHTLMFAPFCFAWIAGIGRNGGWR